MREVRDYLRLGHDANGGGEPPILYMGLSSAMYLVQPPAIIATQLTPNFEKEKESGVLRMQAMPKRLGL